MKDLFAAVLIVVVLLVGVAAGWVGSSSLATKAPSSVTVTSTAMPPTVSPTAEVVNLDIIPDWGGAGYDAFVIPSHVNQTTPTPATSSSPPGPNDNNITVSAGVPITFVITSLDTGVNENFTGHASTEFTIYNDSASGYVALHYSIGQSISMLPIGHTFTISSLNINIPVPPDTVVTFTYTFSSPGVYEYVCLTPCGPGMGLVGYMDGYVIVTS